MSKEAKYYRLGARIFVDFSGTIAVPAVLAALLGKWLDGRWGTKPMSLIILLVLALALTAYAVVKKARVYKKAYESLIQEERRV